MRTISKPALRSIAPIFVAFAVVALSFGAHDLWLPRHQSGDIASPVPARAAMSAAPSVAPQTWATKDFPKNQHGQTYGSDAEAGSPAQMPDLIAVITQAGATGFVRKDDLLAAQGDPSLFSSPDQALSWQSAHRADTSVPAYAPDGTTRVGSFVVHPGGGCEGHHCATETSSPN